MIKLFEIFQEDYNREQNQIILVDYNNPRQHVQEQIKYGLDTYFEINGLDVSIDDLQEIDINEAQHSYLKLELESKEYGCYLTFFVRPVNFIVPPHLNKG